MEYSTGSQEKSGGVPVLPIRNRPPGERTFPMKTNVQENGLSHTQTFSICDSHIDQVTGREDTKPWSRISLRSDSLPESLYMYQPSVEGCLPRDLYRGVGFVSLFCHRQAGREMGDTKRQNVQPEKMWFVVSLCF